jgi:nitrate/nitrite transporter NarK
MFAVGLYVCFLDNANNLIQHRFCFDQVRAGRIVAITYVVVASCSAPLGLAVDYFGHRRYFTIAGMIVYSIAHLIILVYPQCYSNI